jgi:hypothetical protein
MDNAAADVGGQQLDATSATSRMRAASGMSSPERPLG